jgi:hypothetical protein
MNVGDILKEDGEVPELRRIHEESGFDFKFPDLSDSRFAIQRSLRHEGKLMAAVVVKLEGECYLFLDHKSATPFERFFGLQIMQKDLLEKAREIGLDQLYCVLPPEVERRFGARLVEHGWKKDRGWTKYTYELE